MGRGRRGGGRPTRRAVLAAIEERGTAGMTVRHLTDRFAGGRDRSEVRREVRRVLRELERDGKVVPGRGKRYVVAEHARTVVGTVRARRGVVTVEPRDGGAPILLPRRGSSGAMDGDLVAVRVERPRRRARELGMEEGTVVRVLERRRRSLVGRWVSEGVRAHVQPLERKLDFPVVVTGSRTGERPRDGDLVVVTVDRGPVGGRAARGTLVEVIGRPGEPGVEEAAVLRMHEIPVEFPDEALAEAEGLDPAVQVDRGRWDLRDRPAVTIDPPTARDYDDAVNAARGRGGEIVVEVHIADVSHYVREGSALDAAARERGTSVYLPGVCVPMLPERLSNDLCSLREGVDRYAFTVRFAVAPDGRVVRETMRPSVIRSRHRLTYDEVFSWLEGGGRARWGGGVTASLRLLDEAAARLRARRRERGALDFELAEPVVLLDPEGRLLGIESRAHNRAQRLIEELMIAANEAVARRLMEAGQPALFRVHEPPDPDRVVELAAVLGELGIAFELPEDGSVPPAVLQGVLDAAEGSEAERLVGMLVLRTLKRALYSPDPLGHYALATPHYLHFTSPIRRYPDLVVHRMLRRLLEDGRPVAEEEREALEEALEGLGTHCSETERRAEDAERTVLHWKKVLFLRDRVGEEFDAHVTGVAEFGLFVELDGILVEGLVHVTELGDDYFRFDGAHTLVGERTGVRYRLGDPIRVRLVRVDLDTMRLDLAAAEVVPRRRRRPRPPRA